MLQLLLAIRGTRTQPQAERGVCGASSKSELARLDETRNGKAILKFTSAQGVSLRGSDAQRPHWVHPAPSSVLRVRCQVPGILSVAHPILYNTSKRCCGTDTVVAEKGSCEKTQDINLKSWRQNLNALQCTFVRNFYHWLTLQTQKVWGHYIYFVNLIFAIYLNIKLNIQRTSTGLYLFFLIYLLYPYKLK